MSVIRGGIRSVAWWVTAGLGVAVLALNVAGELDLGIAGRSTLYLLWMGVWTPIGLFGWAMRGVQGFPGCVRAAWMSGSRT
jgi:hypothetical protein